MFSYYKTLPSLLPQILLLARPGSEIALVSPWIEDILIHPPLLEGAGGRLVSREMPLSAFLLYVLRAHDLRIAFVLRADIGERREEDARRIIVPLESERPGRVVVVRVPYLHAKPIVTESFVIHSSANILSTSFYRNVELVALLANRYNSVRKWLEVELGLSL